MPCLSLSFACSTQPRRGKASRPANPVGKNRVCGEPLWQLTREIWRYEPAKYIHKKLHRFLDYCVIDEIHEEKSAESAQANAMGALAASCKRILALTGTLIGGYAEHIRPLLLRLAPTSLIEEGFGWISRGCVHRAKEYKN
jgi:hypothetical protein